ncbi:MAG TPA: hypothetical protein VG452_02095 [Egibacteraceae bacterium]|nr:hypothetical protein [Egibacteraceae bacterium]
MKPECELSTRTSIRAFHAREHLLIVAEGELPSPGWYADIEQSPIEVFPPQFSLLRCQRPGLFPQVITPFRRSESFFIGATRPEQVTVHHADGSDQVAVEDCGAELGAYAQAVGQDAPVTCAEGADEATGFSKALSFDEAFADALTKLPAATPTHPDLLETVRVLEIGAFFGGIAGFHDLWVRICRTHD